MAQPRPDDSSARPSPGRSLVHNPRLRALAFQALLVLFVVWIGYEAVANATANLHKQRIATGFGFLNEPAGFGILATVGTWAAGYSEASSYGRAFLVGLVNTLAVAVVGIVLATAIGFLVGVARLSSNWLIARMATVYVEVMRNVPLLLQIFFWYFAVLAALPLPRQSHDLGAGVYLNIRGLFLPRPVPDEGFAATVWAFLLALGAAAMLHRWARARHARTGRPFPALRAGLALVVIVPLAVFLATGAPLSFDTPELRGFNFQGGMAVIPEFVALLLALALYTAAFIGEIVRAGILAVSPGQSEAARALGLRHGATLRLVVVPQALRVIVPPLTSQYLNLTKNSSLAVAVAYPDLVSVFAGTTLNQTGQALEVLAITMSVYLALSLATALFMNWYNARVALVER